MVLFLSADRSFICWIHTYKAKADGGDIVIVEFVLITIYTPFTMYVCQRAKIFKAIMERRAR